ncbi:MarR family winged helix-turn-helix transcriptional regulator [Streptomyces sp. CB01881]|uniref:MarR family winged helix-turn-helix transcriptional regulator n=1 Tax=Streptomyces sp. CB01881 TaxID=2078691 RepID=UPI000CDBB8D7|nr:MarR family winged helix-turn-helix transcriptional regulator [Streptomyces sp. CB01881]AUY48780.1 MarR family transcriptional regulator [Streptomyces sp. CB01881]TYC77269.1 MarR family transcriptional regulator [Streptomyces sp. CB01881]
MNDVNPSPLTASVVFRLGTLGSVVTARFTEALAVLGLKPKHVGLMVALESGAPPSQLELARTMAVAPSLVVSLADHLEQIGALDRVRDPADRRRQVLALTDAGRALLADCTALAHRLDAELTASLDGPEREALRRALGVLGAEAGLPTQD